MFHLMHLSAYCQHAAHSVLQLVESGIKKDYLLLSFTSNTFYTRLWKEKRTSEANFITTITLLLANERGL